MSVEVQSTVSESSLSSNLQLDVQQKEEKEFVTEEELCSPSPDTSLASMENGDDGTDTEDCFEDDENSDHKFIKKYVEELFIPNMDIPYEDKARFGDLCKLAKGREWFAKYIDSQRKYSQCVDETTFYKLVYTFALVLFECGVADDYEPAKILMNMSFTYYYIPDLRQAFFSDMGSSDVNENVTKVKAPSLATPSPTQGKKSVWQNANKWIKKEVESAKQVFNDTPTFQELRQNMWKKKSPSTESSTYSISERRLEDSNVSPSSSNTSIFSRSSSMNSIGKIYLYEHLKGQAIWKSLRFWNQAFFLAVHAERKQRCSSKEWRNLSSDERSNVNLAVSNITFGQLGTFVNNMKCLGLPKETCRQFLHKQSVIGSISTEQIDMLNDQIEDDVTF